MGCDIYSVAQVRKNEQWVVCGATFSDPYFVHDPFANRNYAVFGFLAGVRNHEVPVLQEMRGFPEDGISQAIRDRLSNGRTTSWVTLRQLLEFDYDQKFVDTVYGSGLTTVRNFLPDEFFADVEILKTLGSPDDVRVVFDFD